MAEQRTINTLSDLSPIVDATGTDLGVLDLWWRGHASAAWKLVPGVFRIAGGHEFEMISIRRFRQRARSRHTACPNTDDLSGWLFLMQHYGLPTRLLDWSESPLVALYFAVQGDGPGALFALNPFFLNEFQFGESAIVGPENDSAQDLVRGAFRPEAKSSKANVAALIVDEIDPRMLAQLTAFTIHGSGIPLEEVSNNERYLRRIEIPEKAKHRLRQELLRLGVRRSNLFPDLHNLALELKEYRYRKVSRLDAGDTSTNS